MCEGSLYIKNRLATSKEKLVIKNLPDRSYSHIGGYFPSTGDGPLVCVRKTTEAIVKQVKFSMARDIPASVEQYRNKRNVPVTLIARPFADSIEFPNKVRVPITAMIGVRIDIGIPVRQRVRTAAGMARVKEALREQDKLPAAVKKVVA